MLASEEMLEVELSSPSLVVSRTIQVRPALIPCPALLLFSPLLFCWDKCMSGPAKVDLHDVTLVCEDGEKVVTHLQTERQPQIFQLLSLHTTLFRIEGEEEGSECRRD